MLEKIDVQISDFTYNIKTTKSHEELLVYMNSNFYASIKLLVFASKTFAMYGRILLFFIIALTGLFVTTSIESTGRQLRPILNSSYLFVIVLGLIFLTLAYVLHYKKLLTLSIQESKSIKEKAEKSEESTAKSL